MNPLVTLASLYGRHFPVRKGKRLIADWASKTVRTMQDRVLCVAAGGMRFEVVLSDPMYRDLYFLGEYEPEVTRLLRRVIKPGDAVVDVGANFGWYSVLFKTLVGPGGQVHAFEPEPVARSRLLRNLKMNAIGAEVRVRDEALGDSRGSARIHTFAGLTSGHSSLSSLGRQDARVSDCTVTTLSEYVVGSMDRPPAFVKCDVEGSELAVLKGAGQLLGSAAPPMWLIEMNAVTAAAFGYSPGDILEYMKFFDYRFFAIRSSGVQHLDSTAAWKHGDNMLCVTSAHKGRLSLMESTTARE